MFLHLSPEIALHWDKSVDPDLLSSFLFGDMSISDDTCNSLKLRVTVESCDCLLSLSEIASNIPFVPAQPTSL